MTEVHTQAMLAASDPDSFTSTIGNEEVTGGWADARGNDFWFEEHEDGSTSTIIATRLYYNLWED